MLENPQTTYQTREVKIEALYKQLAEVTDDQEKDALLKELELLTGVRIFY